MRPKNRTIDDEGSKRLSATFFRMPDEARFEGLHPVMFGLALALFSIKYLSERSSAVERPVGATPEPIGPQVSWQDLQRAEELQKALVSHAVTIERGLDQFEGLFTQNLLQGIERLREATLRQWVDEIAGVPLWDPRTRGRPFVTWLNTQLDEEFLDLGRVLATPPSIARLMVRLADIRSGECILDPFGGNGAVLSQVVEATSAQPQPSNLYLHAQEKNRMAWAWMKLRLLLQGHTSAQLNVETAFGLPHSSTEGA